MSGIQLPETEWTRRWERQYRHSRWVEHDGKFYPIGTKVEKMEPRPPSLATWTRVNYAGQRFGTLVVLHRAGRDIFGRATWAARCSVCKRDYELRSDVLRAGAAPACCGRTLPP